MDSLHFLRPWWLLALVPLALAVWALARGAGPAAGWRRVCDPALLRFLADGAGEGSRPRWPAALVAVGGLLGIVALAGPAWEKLPRPVYRDQAARVVVLSLAPTMEVADLRPSRLARARFKLMDLLERSDEGRVGLLVFAGEPFTVSPLTDDAATIAAMVPVLETDMMPVPGRRLAPALRLAGELLDQGGGGPGRVLVLADGAADGAAAIDQAAALARRHRVSVIGVGTPAGGPLPAAGGFRRDARGGTVLHRLEEDLLAAVAAAGGGSFRRITADAADLAAVLPPPGRGGLDRAGITGREADQWREAGPWLLLPLAVMAALAFRRGWLTAAVVVMLALPPPAAAFDWMDLWRTPEQRAAAAFRAGRHGAAAAGFEDPAWRGSALYRGGDYDAAAAAFAAVETADGHYNRGNALARAGRLEEAVEAYAEALQSAPGHADARHNLALVERLLEQRRSAAAESETKKPADDGDAGSGDHGKGGSGEAGDEGAPAADGGAEPGGSRAGTSRAGDEPGGRAGEPPAARARVPGEDDPAAGGTGAGAEEPGRDATAAAPASPRGPRPGADRKLGGTAPPTAAEDRPLPPGDAPPPTAGGMDRARAATEGEQATAQWLRRIPDDPGGLLRRKFMLEHYRRRQAEGAR